MTQLTCGQVEDLLPELLDGTVDSQILDDAVGHIAVCDACTFTKGEYDNLQALYRDHGALKLPDDARRRIRALLEPDQR